MFKWLRNALYEWWDKRKNRREAAREAQQVQDEEFKRTHEPCPLCDEWIQKGLSVCPHCEAPFRDPVALETWKLKQEVAMLREQAANAHEQDTQERKKKRSNNQGCGCLLMLGALVISILFPTFGALLFVIGLVMLTVGLVS